MQRHDTTTQTLHWLMLVLIVGTYGVGLFREMLPKGDFRTWLLSLHMSVGLAVMALTALRLGWRFMAPALAPVPMSPAMALGARLAHILLYLSMLALPVVGLLAAWIKGRTVGFFGLPLPSPLAIDRGMAKMLEEAHEVMAHGFMALVGLHAAAAIYHHLVLKDETLLRMMPSSRATPAV